MQELIVLPLALGLDYMLGDPPSRWHPVCLMGNMGYALEKRWRNFVRVKPRSTEKKLFWGGVLAWFCVVFCNMAMTAFCMDAVQSLSFGLGAMCSALVIAFCLAPSSLAEHAQRIILPLQRQNLDAARQALAMIVGRDVQSLDAHGIARAGIESVSENVVDAVLSTLFWAALGLVFWGYTGGAVLAVMHRACNVLDAQWGKKDATYLHFGACAARVDDALNYIPARLALPCILLAAAFLRLYGKWKRKAYSSIWRGTLWQNFLLAWKYRYAHASPNSAWSESAFAAVLQVRLGGPLSYKGRAVDYPYIGEGTAQATVQHMRAALQLMWLSVGLWTMLSCAAAVLWP